jgi:exfoliative toxin A/B
MSFIRRIPIPMSALALGTAALGNLLLSYSPVIRAVCGVIATALVLLILARIAFDFAGVRKELENPAALAVFPAFFMALMLLATYLKPYAATPAKILWIAALALQLLVVALFVMRFVASFKLAQVLPGWFLVFVGFVVGSVTSPAFSAQPVGRVLLYAGLIGYVGVLVAVVYRMVTVGDLPEPALPTVAIIAAPPSLCLAGYLAVIPVKEPLVAYVLLAFAGASIVYVLTRLPRILKTRFYPSYAALTFPFVISAIALKQSSVFLAKTAAGSFIPKAAVMAMDGFATVMVLYVLVRYAMFLLAPAEETSPAAVTATA